MSGRSLVDLDFFPVAHFDLNKWQILTDHYLQDELNFLGSGWISVRNEDAPLNGTYGSFPRKGLGNHEVDWNRDQRTGFQFQPDGQPGEELQKAFETPGVDVKWTWEFTRMHQLPQLALAIQIFPDLKEKIHNKIEHHLSSFNEQCPCLKGIHWSSPMEVAIRLVNLLVAYDMLKSSRFQLEVLVQQMATEHWNFLRNNLEDKDGYGTNHYLANLMGLIVAGYYLEGEEVRQSQSWAVGELEYEVTKQFHKDGFNFEYSTYYHRLSTEIVMIGFLAALKSGFQLQQASLATLEKALIALKDIRKPDGSLPLFGDNDSGRILDLDPAGILKGELELRPENSSFCTSELEKKGVYKWFYQDILDRLPGTSTSPVEEEKLSIDYRPLPYKQEWKIAFIPLSVKEIKRVDYPEAGLYVFRSPDFYLAINLMCNAHGHRYRGHMHNDKGSFELTVHQQDLVKDPGIYSYTASVEERNRYRSTEAHPVPFTGIEQNRFLEQSFGLFHMKLDVSCELLAISPIGLTAQIKYRGVKHIRKFEILEDHLLITDFCNKEFKVNKQPSVSLTAGYGKTL